MTTFQNLPSEESTVSRMRGRVREVSLPMLSPPDSAGYAEHATPDGRRVFIADDVIDALVRLEREHHPNETGGLLFGRYFTDGRNRCTIVTAFVPPEPGEVKGTRSSVTITAEGARRMRARAHHLIPCADPIGWGHTHPTFPPFFSGTDRTEQRLWTESISVGIVLSGIRDAAELYHVYVGPESTLAIATSSSRPRTTPVMPVAEPRREGPAQVGPSRRPRRTRRVPAYRVGLAAAAVAAVTLALLGWHDAMTARQAAERAEAQSTAVAHLAALTGANTRSGQATAARALAESSNALRTATRAERVAITQIGVMRTRTAQAGQAAANATALAERAFQESQTAIGSVAALKSEVDALRAAAAQHAQPGTKQKPSGPRKGKTAQKSTPPATASTGTGSGR